MFSFVRGVELNLGVHTSKAKLGVLGYADPLLIGHPNPPRASGGVIAMVVVIQMTVVSMCLQLFADPTVGESLRRAKDKVAFRMNSVHPLLPLIPPLGIITSLIPAASNLTAV